MQGSLINNGRIGGGGFDGNGDSYALIVSISNSAVSIGIVNTGEIDAADASGIGVYHWHKRSGKNSGRGAVPRLIDFSGPVTNCGSIHAAMDGIGASIGSAMQGIIHNSGAITADRIGLDVIADHPLPSIQRLAGDVHNSGSIESDYSSIFVKLDVDGWDDSRTASMTGLIVNDGVLISGFGSGIKTGIELVNS